MITRTMITRMEASNYRCFAQVGVSLGEFQVIAGANGSGKTTLLDIPLVLGDMLRGRNVAAAFMERVLERAARAGSLLELVHDAATPKFGLALELSLPQVLIDTLVESGSLGPTLLRYEVTLTIVAGTQLEVESESLFAFTPNADTRRFIIRRPTGSSGRSTSEVELCHERRLPFGGERLSLAQMDRTKLALARLAYEDPADFPAGRWLLDLLLDGVVGFEPQWMQLRKASPPGLPRHLMPSGENLPWLALQLQREQPEQFAAWVEHVRTALPQIIGIEAREREEDHHAYFRVDYESGFAVTSTGLSEGTLRIMALTLIAYVLDPPRLLIVEEPEYSIHPQAVETIMQSLRSLYDSQIWVSTHSPVVLAGCRLDELRITRIERSGAANVTAGPEHPRLAAWKGAIDLGSLFASGVFE